MGLLEEKAIGTIKMQSGTLVREPPTRTTPKSTETELEEPPPGAHRRFWESWLPQVRQKTSSSWGGSKSGGRKNFYKVWKGRTKGVFCKWSHCRRSIAGFDKPGFKGFQSLSEAYAYEPHLAAT